MRGTDFELFVNRIALLSQKQRDKLPDLLQRSTRREQVTARIVAAAAMRPCSRSVRRVLDAKRIVSPESTLYATIGVFHTW